MKPRDLEWRGRGGGGGGDGIHDELTHGLSLLGVKVFRCSESFQLRRLPSTSDYVRGVLSAGLVGTLRPVSPESLMPFGFCSERGPALLSFDRPILSACSLRPNLARRIANLARRDTGREF